MNVFATSPAHAPAREARKKIEQLAGLLGSRTMPFDRKGVSDRLARAVRSLYAVLDTSIEAPAHADGLTECARILGEVRALLAPYFPPLLDETIALVKKAGDEVVDVMLTRRGDARGLQSTRNVPVRPFQASIALPRLHALQRSPIAPPLDIAAPAAAEPPAEKRPPPRKPATLEELRAMAAAAPEPEEPPPPPEAPADAPPPKPVTDDGEILRRVARDCLEDIAALRNLRLPIPTETWTDQAPFEQRLLDNVDAFVALGADALPTATLFHAEAPAPDPSRAFAIALTLGCIEGTDTVDVAIATMKQSAPEELSGWAEGFMLAPSPAIDTEVPALLEAPNPLLVSLALGVLGARGTLPPDAPERVLARRDASLASLLARALGLSVPKTKALAVLANIADDPSFQADPSALVSAWTSLLRRGDGEARPRLRNAIRAKQHVVEAAELLALSGRGDDVGLLLEVLAQAPSPRLVRAVARHGHVDAIPALIALLDSKDDKLVPVVAAALDFVTNAGLIEVQKVKWTPESEATRDVRVPVADRMAWEKWYVAAKPKLDPRQKLRHGLPFTPSMIVAELEAPTPRERRDEAAVELVIATNAGLRFATSDWVAKQKAQLSELRGLVASLGSLAGAWWFAGAGATSK